LIVLADRMSPIVLFVPLEICLMKEIDMLLTDEELKMLEAANTADEWSDACLKVK